MRFGGGYVGPDEGFGDGGDIHACVVHDRVWKCHLDTFLHISELLKAVECFIFIESCV